MPKQTELEKLARHALDRLRERAPQLDPNLIPHLEEEADRVSSQVGEGHYYLPLGGGAGNPDGYAAFKTVPGYPKPKLVLATVLGPDMKPKGSSLSHLIRPTPQKVAQEELPRSQVALLQRRFARMQELTRQKGVLAGTNLRRILIPKDKITERDLTGPLGFVPVTIAIPEAGQDRFTSFRHPHHNFHIHSHPEGWTMHEDAHPSASMLMLKARNTKEKARALLAGTPHVSEEGLPGLVNYLKGVISGRKSTAQQVWLELDVRTRRGLERLKPSPTHVQVLQEKMANLAAFKATKDGRRRWHVNQDAAGTYTCTCPDYTYRHAGKGTSCKHIKLYQVGREGMPLKKLAIEITEGDPRAKAVADTLGKIKAIPQALMLRPGNVRGHLEEPSEEEIRREADRMEAAFPDLLKGTVIRRGAADPIDDMRRAWNNKSYPLPIRALGVPISGLQSALSATGRNDRYIPYADSATIYTKTPGVTSHELGHAADFNDSAGPWSKTLYTTVRYPGGTLLKEYRASRNAVRAAGEDDAKLRADLWRTMAPALGAYGGAGAYGLSQGISALLEKTSPFNALTQRLTAKGIPKGVASWAVRVLPLAAGAAGGHAVAALRNRLAERKERVKSAAHSTVILMLEPRAEAAKKIHEHPEDRCPDGLQDCPGGKGELHMTLVYSGSIGGFTEQNHKDLEEIVQNVCAETAPFEIKIDGSGKFEASEEDGASAVYARVVPSPELLAFREKIVKQMDAKGIPVNREFDFTPHVTLGYTKDEQAKLPSLPAGLGWTVRDLILGVGDEKTRYQLGGAEKTAATALRRRISLYGMSPRKEKINDQVRALLEKTSARVPVLHGTSGRWSVLRPGGGPLTFRGDKNPRAVYVVPKNRAMLPHVEEYARRAVKANGGEPVVAVTKVDTKKGWQPRMLTQWGQANIGDADDALDLVDQLDATPSRQARGPLWEALNRGVGSWENVNRGATLPVREYLSVAKK